MLSGFGEWLEEDPRGRLCMLNRRNYTRNGHDWNQMPDMELESLRGGGGFVYVEGGSRKEGFGRTPRTTLVTGLTSVPCLTAKPAHTETMSTIFKRASSRRATNKLVTFRPYSFCLRWPISVEQSAYQPSCSLSRLYLMCFYCWYIAF